jgi:hypothetical protein
LGRSRDEEGLRPGGGSRPGTHRRKKKVGKRREKRKGEKENRKRKIREENREGI